MKYFLYYAVTIPTYTSHCTIHLNIQMVHLPLRIFFLFEFWVPIKTDGNMESSPPFFLLSPFTGGLLFNGSTKPCDDMKKCTFSKWYYLALFAFNKSLISNHLMDD